MPNTVGPYRLIRHLATGGMAEVWLARRVDSEGEEVALKRILPHLARDERFTTMFLDEAEIGSRLSHPNIVEVIEVGHNDDEYFIAMEYVEGPDLAQILDRCEETDYRVDVGVAARVVVGVLRALDYAHDFELDGVPQNIVHRDVSPHNILVTADGEVKLIDFGVAKAVERHSKTETGFVKGKLSYMSPEQIGQEELDRRADLFGVGALFFELLTGRTPFGRELTAVSAILEADPPDLREERDDVPEDIAAAIERALEKKAEDRWATAGDMADAIEAALEGRDASAATIAQFLAELETSTELHLRETSDLRAGRTTTPVSAPQALRDKASAKPAPKAPPIAPAKAPTQAPDDAVELTGALAAESGGKASVAAPVIALILLVLGFGGYLGRHQIAAMFADEPAEPAQPAENASRDSEVVETASKLAEPDASKASEADEGDEGTEKADVESGEELVEGDTEDLETAEVGFTFDEAEAAAVYADAEAMRRIELSKPPENWLIEFWAPALIDAVAEPTTDDKRWDPGDPAVVAVLDFTPRPEIDDRETSEPAKKKPRKRRVKRRPRRKPTKKKKPDAKKKKTDVYKRMERSIPTF